MVQMVSKEKPSWGLAEAKARRSEVLKRAKVEPQVIERRGRAVGLVVDIDMFKEAEQRAKLGSAEAACSPSLLLQRPFAKPAA